MDCIDNGDRFTIEKPKNNLADEYSALTKRSIVFCIIITLLYLCLNLNYSILSLYYNIIYPSLLFHVIVLPPVFALSGYLLFTSIPLLLKTDYDRGIFMGHIIQGFAFTSS
jgi:hypothetical protein